MKQSIQLRLGQQLTMTPQLQQAIRLLQLSTLDLQQEIQETLDSNFMLERDEESNNAESEDGTNRGTADVTVDRSEREFNAAEDIPEELPVDSRWEDVYGPAHSGSGMGQGGGDIEFLTHRPRAKTLHDHLNWQMNLTPFSDTDLAIATAIIDSIDVDGYLRADLEDILNAVGTMEDVGIEEVEMVLHRVQRYDPPGVAARGPAECLNLQLQQLPDDTPFRNAAITLCRDHFHLLAARDEAQIKRRLELNDAQLREVISLIRSLNPRPGRLVEETETQYIVPDVIVSKRAGAWRVELNQETTPRLRINDQYSALIRRADTSRDNSYLKTQLQEARWFLKSLQSRNETLLRVASKIVEFQRGFFDYGEEAMKPLVLREIAEALDMHESTVSRVTNQKFMHTPRGTFEFKYFFSSHVGTDSGGECSATAIRALIKKLVAAEKPNKPLSDNKIATILSDQGINVARRTIAKYRESMAIPPSNERRRLV
jgi:RNA polymerase sigma-54 factor